MNETFRVLYKYTRCMILYCTSISELRIQYSIYLYRTVRAPNKWSLILLIILLNYKNNKN